MPTLPYLFVGSGLSRRYLGIPTWKDLLRDFHPQLKQEYPFDYYLSLCNGNLPQLATQFAKTFHPIWWKADKYASDREKYNLLAGTNIEIPFKLELAKLVSTFTLTSSSDRHEVDDLKKVCLSGIITTNWDNFLSEVFPDFKPYFGQQELLFADNLHVGDIYKIHGAIDRPESLVVTEGDYNLFNDRNIYLASKLLTIFVEHPVIFFGYSLTDENIRNIITSIVNCLDKSNISKLQDRLIFIEWNKNLAEPTISDSVFMAEGLTIPIKLIQASSFKPVYAVLADLQQKIPLKILRKIKSAVYDLVSTNKPTKIMYAGDLSQIEENEKIEFVIGVGLVKDGILASGQHLNQFGYHSPDTNDIIRDILFDDANYDAKTLIKENLTKILRGGTVYCPYFKYFRQSGYLNKNGTLNSHGDAAIASTAFPWSANISKRFQPPKGFSKKIDQIVQKHKTLDELITNESPLHSLMAIPLLKNAAYSIEELNILLNDYYTKSLHKNTSLVTYFKKAVCFFDYLKYAKEV